MLRNRIIAIILSIALNVDTINAIETVQERDVNASSKILFGSHVSDLPTGGLIHDFKPLKKDLFNNVDLTGTGNSKLFTGYGVYDKYSNNCVNVDAPSADGTNVKTKFEDFKIYNGHTYSKSLQKHTFQQCQALAANYNGYIAQITTYQESDAVSAYYKDNEFWIGLQRDGACPSKYVNQDGSEERYNGYMDDSLGCDDNTPYTAINKGIWTQKSKYDTAYCVMEMDTEDYTKPIKTCAPWWSLERTYKLPSSSKYKVLTKDKDGQITEFDIRNIAQTDFPKRIKVCNKIKPNAVVGSTNIGTRDVYCNSYYDKRLSPTCYENPEQDICFVDECRGAIKNRCAFVDAGPAPLEYSKNKAVKNNSEIEIKNRTKITINKYRCPIEAANDSCEEEKTVTMLPVVCPGTDVDENGTEKKPIKVYGSEYLSGPNKYDASGNLKTLYGKCPDGNLVEVPFDTLSQTNKVCVKRSTEVSKRQWDQVCSVSKSYNDLSVEAAVHDIDSYKMNPNCIRINNIEDARPKQDVVIDYETKGLSGISIVKATIDGKEENKFTTLLPSEYYKQVFDSDRNKTDGIQRIRLNITKEMLQADKDLNLSNMPTFSCDGLGAQDETNELNIALKKYQENGVATVFDYNNGEILRLHDIKKKSDCETILGNLDAQILFSKDGNKTTSQTNAYYESTYGLTSTANINANVLIDKNSTSPGVCVGVTNNTNINGDIYKKISIAGKSLSDPQNITLHTKMDVSYDRCKEIALCTQTDIINQKDYLGTQTCVLNETATSGQQVLTEYQNEVNQELTKTRQTLEQKQGASGGEGYLESLLTQNKFKGTISPDKIDGYKDIYAIIDFNQKNFGYISSWNNTNYKSNIVKVNGLVVSPIAEPTLIEEDVREDYYWNDSTYLNQTPDPEGALYAGMEGGAAYAVGWAIVAAVAAIASVLEFTAIATTLGSLFGPWGLVIAVIIAIIVYYVTQPKNVRRFTAHNESEIYTIRGPQYRYVENPYGYENRMLYHRNGEDRIKYAAWEYGNDALQKDTKEPEHFSGLQESKKKFYETVNIPAVGHTFENFESRVPINYPSKNIWNPWAVQHDSGTGKGTLDINKYHKRTVNTVYMGASNTVTIVVPYLGDYKVSAYNAGGNKISSSIINSSAFVGGNSPYGTMMLYANAQLGKNMQLSPNLSGKACADDMMVDVGGGLSGVYYALGKTDRYSNFECSQSDALYIQANRITTLKIRPLDQESSFVIELPKPLVYINRVFIVSLGEKEDRLYRCYDNDFPTCSGFEDTNSNKDK